jgi:hypothetical protein
MVTENSDPGAVTPILQAAVQACGRSGESITVEVSGERVGPPARAMRSQGTSFRVAARYTPPTAGGQDGSGSDVAREVTVRHEATSVWEALTLTRLELEREGWTLLIAAARLDSYALHADRHADSTVVNRLDNPRIAEGLLVDAPVEAVGTVAEQQRRYQTWLATTSAPQSDPS